MPWSLKPPVCQKSTWASIADAKAFIPSRSRLGDSRLSVVRSLKRPSKKTIANKREKDKKRIQELERELRRKDKAPAETAALLVLRKKLNDYWGLDNEDS